MLDKTALFDIIGATAYHRLCIGSGIPSKSQWIFDSTCIPKSQDMKTTTFFNATTTFFNQLGRRCQCIEQLTEPGDVEAKRYGWISTMRALSKIRQKFHLLVTLEFLELGGNGRGGAARPGASSKQWRRRHLQTRVRAEPAVPRRGGPDAAAPGHPAQLVRCCGG
ncbi:hypothetical protein ON010_g5153 [Phytophthora cinnamomi]|nr:hypothetical protein ON010_g5153 [Phytophthora cinnamomi]